MSTDANGQSWQDRLILASTEMADTRNREDQSFRQVASEAPLDELRIFLSSPSGMYEGHARAVMREVLRQRESDMAKRASRKDERRNFYLKVLGGIVVGAVLGIGGSYFSGILLCS